MPANDRQQIMKKAVVVVVLVVQDHVDLLANAWHRMSILHIFRRAIEMSVKVKWQLRWLLLLLLLLRQSDRVFPELQQCKRPPDRSIDRLIDSAGCAAKATASHLIQKSTILLF
jgi:hypothetical protein